MHCGTGTALPAVSVYRLTVSILTVSILTVSMIDMKDILRKIFFWGVPAKGAFFGMTLLFILPRVFYTIGFSIVLSVFLRGGKSGEIALYLLAALVGGMLLYALITFLHFLPKIPMTRKPYLIGLCCCAVLMLVFWISTVFIGDKEIYRHLWWVIPVLYVAWGIAYAFHPTVKVWEWLAAIVPLVACGSLFFYMNVALSRKVISEIGGVPQVNGVFSLIGESSGMQWLLSICCILLLATSYLMFARVVAKGGNVPIRSLFGRGVTTLWIVFVVMYLASICLAMYSILDYRKARKELDAYWGMPVTTKALVELYAKNGNIDQAFWKKFNGQAAVGFPKFFNKYDGINLIVGYSDAVLPPDIYVEWRKVFNESAKLRRSEEMMDSPPPLYERKADFTYDRFFSRISSRCREITRLEMWRVRFALEEKEIETAKKALLRLDNICTALQSDYNQIAGLLWGAIEQMRAQALCRILASGLADEAWLREQSAILLEKERLIPEVHKQMILGEAAHTLDLFEMVAEHASFASFLLLPESWGFWGREGAAMARAYCISDFADFPEKPVAIFARMIASAMRLFGTNRIPTLVATLRISRGLIEAELVRLKTGAYPAAMENLPEDPFTGKALQYAIRDCEISEQRFQVNDNDDGDTSEVVQQMRKWIKMTDEQAKELARHTQYAFKTEWRTTKAVQIWSVGPDGISGDGLGEENTRKSRDDIRFFVEIRP